MFFTQACRQGSPKPRKPNPVSTTFSSCLNTASLSIAGCHLILSLRQSGVFCTPRGAACAPPEMLMFPDDLTTRTGQIHKPKKSSFLHLFKHSFCKTREREHRSRAVQSAARAGGSGRRWHRGQEALAVRQSAAAPSPAGCGSVSREAGGEVLCKHTLAASPRAAHHLNHRSPTTELCFKQGVFLSFISESIG